MCGAPKFIGISRRSVKFLSVEVYQVYRSKNIKPMSNFNSAKPLPILNALKLELQLDYAGPLSDGEGKQIYILVVIDRYSKCPLVILICSTGAKEIIKFSMEYIYPHISSPMPSKLPNTQASKTN